MVEQLLNLAHFLDTPLPDPEQVIEVPKILSDDVPMRALVRETQLAEQLVEVPTIVSWSLLQLITKQNVDIPVPGRGEGISGLQGFLPGQSSSASSSSPAGVHGSAVWPGEGFFFFALFPERKSAKIGSHSGSDLLPESCPSTPAAHVDSLAVVELLAKFQQVSDQVGDLERRYSHNAEGSRRMSRGCTASSLTRGIVFNNLRIGPTRLQETTMVQVDGFR